LVAGGEGTDTLNRQSATYAREGIDLDVSTVADWVGAAAATLMPLAEVIQAHVFAAERVHADDTTVPVLAKGKTRTGRLWTYVRDDRPLAGPDPPAAVFLLFPGSERRASRTALGELCRVDAGRTPMRGSTGCTKPTANRARSLRLPAGHMEGASSSI
jgi:hypothetical protein